MFDHVGRFFEPADKYPYAPYPTVDKSLYRATIVDIVPMPRIGTDHYKLGCTSGRTCHSATGQDRCKRVLVGKDDRVALEGADQRAVGVRNSLRTLRSWIKVNKHTAGNRQHGAVLVTDHVFKTER